MKVFSDDTDTWVAEDLADVARVFEEHNGFSLDDESLTLRDFEQVPDDQPITICNVHDRGADDKETRTAAEWAALNGRGLLCSTEW